MVKMKHLPCDEKQLNLESAPGELTDQGRKSTLATGQSFRNLYVNQLKFMPESIQKNSSIYLRTTPIPRALESVQQAFTGMYPKNKRNPSFVPPVIYSRAPADETLYPNESSCHRFAQLSRAFADRSAQRWNDSEDMEYLNRLISKWMPENSPRVKIDSKPRLSGVMDTVNATRAHGPLTKLPKEFYDKRGLSIIDRLAVEEWFAGYAESREYRMVGIGALAGDVMTRMMGKVDYSNSFRSEASSANQRKNEDYDHGNLKFAMSGCHDSTIAAFLSSLGAFRREGWPPYTSYVAVELFQRKSNDDSTNQSEITLSLKSVFERLFGGKKTTDARIGRTPLTQLSDEQQSRLDGYYVRLRYNDRVMKVPGCAAAGAHLPDDDSFCTLVSVALRFWLADFFFKL